MIVVKRIKIVDFKVFYEYYDDDDGIFVFVNEQSQFVEGLLDVNDPNTKMTEEQAEEARNATPREVMWLPIDIKDAREWLQVNNFDLEEE